MEGLQPLQQVLMHPDRALRDAFDRKSPQRFPVFKKKFVCADSLRYPQGFRLDGDRVWLPKLGLAPLLPEPPGPGGGTERHGLQAWRPLVRGGPDRGRDSRAAAPVPEHGGRRPWCGAS